MSTVTVRQNEAAILTRRGGNSNELGFRSGSQLHTTQVP